MNREIGFLAESRRWHLLIANLQQLRMDVATALGDKKAAKVEPMPLKEISPYTAEMLDIIIKEDAERRTPDVFKGKPVARIKRG